jgi:hypothetical protein
VAELVPSDFIRPEGSAPHHVGHDRMILCELVQLLVSVQVRTAIAYVDDTELRTQLERHRHGCPHATQFRVLRGFFKNAGIGVTNRCLELRQDSLRVRTVGPEKPSE